MVVRLQSRPAPRSNEGGNVKVSQVFQLSIPAAAGLDFRVGAVRGREAIHAPFSFEIACAPLERANGWSAAEDDPVQWIGTDASLSWAIAGDGSERRIDAVIEEVVSAAP